MAENNYKTKEIPRQRTMSMANSNQNDKGREVQHSEIIAKWIINKVISLAITRNDLGIIEDMIPNECFVFTKKIIDAYLASTFISYERDDKQELKDKTHNTLPLFDNEEGIEIKDLTDNDGLNKDFDSKFELKNAFYDNWYRGDNIWASIEEPPTVEPDRFVSSIMSVEKASKKQSEPMSSSELPLTMTNAELGSRKQTRMTKAFIDFSSKKEKAKRKPSVDFGSFDIPENEIVMPEPTDLLINELRKEKEAQLKKIEEENRKIIKKQIEVQEQTREGVMKQKEYAKANITIDSNGKIVFIKGYPVESLSTEFILPKTELKDIKKVSSLPKQPHKQKKTKEKAMIPGSPSIEAKADKIKQPKEEKNIKLLKAPTIRDKDKQKGTIIPVMPSSVKDPLKKDIVAPSLVADNPFAGFDKRIERVPINPCGSCFDLISLEIGVSFAEEKKYKTGGKDFFKAFNKYSIENYNKRVKDHAIMQPTLTSNHFRTATDYNINTKYPVNLTESFLFNFNSTVSEANKGNRPDLTHSKMLMTNQYSFNPSIKLEKMNLSSLRSAMDDLNLINETQEKANGLNNPWSREDIFKQKIDKAIVSFSKTKKQLETMNTFAKSIVASNQWGRNDTQQKNTNSYIRLPHRPKIKDIEMDFNVVRSRNKLPRERLRVVGLTTVASSSTSVDFNKFLSPNKLFKR